jgi:hypothetical protein
VGLAAADAMHLLDDSSDSTEAGVSLGSQYNGRTSFDDNSLAGAQILSATKHEK